MNTNKRIVFLLIGVCIGVLAFSLGRQSGKESTELNVADTSSVEGSQSTTTKETLVKESSTTTVTKVVKKLTTQQASSPSGYITYSNAEHHFTIKYPKGTQVSSTFSTFHEITNDWRLYAGGAQQGKGVVSFSLFTVDQGTYTNGKQTYPLFFTSLVRIGVSDNTKECYTKDAGYANQTVTPVTINGTTFKRFSTQDAGMMKYVVSESYRTIHNNKCYVLEQIKNGSNYKDEKMVVKTNDTTLNSYYKTGETIIKTFSFQ